MREVLTGMKGKTVATYIQAAKELDWLSDIDCEETVSAALHIHKMIVEYKFLIVTARTGQLVNNTSDVVVPFHTAFLALVKRPAFQPYISAT